jgi:hypothetical protein
MSAPTLHLISSPDPISSVSSARILGTRSDPCEVRKCPVYLAGYGNPRPHSLTDGNASPAKGSCQLAGCVSPIPPQRFG